MQRIILPGDDLPPPIEREKEISLISRFSTLIREGILPGIPQDQNGQTLIDILYKVFGELDGEKLLAYGGIYEPDRRNPLVTNPADYNKGVTLSDETYPGCAGISLYVGMIGTVYRTRESRLAPDTIRLEELRPDLHHGCEPGKNKPKVVPEIKSELVLPYNATISSGPNKGIEVTYCALDLDFFRLNPISDEGALELEQIFQEDIGPIMFSGRPNYEPVEGVHFARKIQVA